MQSIVLTEGPNIYYQSYDSSSTKKESVSPKQSLHKCQGLSTKHKIVAPGRHLATGGAVCQVEHAAASGVLVSDCVQVLVLEALRHRGACLRVVSQRLDFNSIDVFVSGAGEVEGQRNVSWEVELTVQRAGAVAGLNGSWGAELVHPRCTCCGAIEALPAGKP